MPNYKAVDAERLDAAMTATADAIREKTFGTDPIPWDADTGFAESVAGITGGGAGVTPAVELKDVNFYDYDGTRLYSYTVAEAAALAELPPLPTRDGLICQGWNWTLDAIKARGRAVDVGAMYITSDGKTRIYITLTEGRTSPMLGVCPNGTVTVDWGDGTTSDELTGTSTTEVKWTPAHNYAQPGDYVITLTVDGTAYIAGDSTENAYSYILRHSSEADTRNRAYQNAVVKVEVGQGIDTLNSYGFSSCGCLKTITIPKTVTKVGGNAFLKCTCLSTVIFPSGITGVNTYTFDSCYSVSRAILSDTTLGVGGGAFRNCPNIASVILPDGIKQIMTEAFENCYGLVSITIPSNTIRFAVDVFNGCVSLKIVDCSKLATIPQINSSTFTGIPADCEIRVPASLVEEWKAATNWSTYADQIVGV